MLAIEVEYLMGRAIAANWEDRTQPEWPPHPQRLFSALVAAHAELEGTADEEAALKWLESLPAPEIKADLYPSFRTSASYFVPVNDEAVKTEKGKVDPRHILERRNRQERYFPAVVPADPVVVFQWLNAEEVEKHGPALRRLVENVTYLGHSASPVRACLRSAPVCPTLRPSEIGERVLRTPGPGRFDRLNQVHELRKQDSMIQAPRGRTQRYASSVAVTGSFFSPSAMIVAMENGPKLSSETRFLRASATSKMRS
jgi:CRISPR-associated protein Csb2